MRSSYRDVVLLGLGSNSLITLTVSFKNSFLLYRYTTPFARHSAARYWSLIWCPSASSIASQSQVLVPFAGQTRYTQTLLEVDDMPWMYNVIAGVAHWTLLAGYLIVPGTFTALQRSGQVQDVLGKDHVGQAVLNTIQNPPLLTIACILFVASAAASGWLYWE
ncbi:hypothetical protein AnigIFM63604_003489 [Aspergillus niger]|uniref:Uncharacterized protein n=1 Tax=Aspergillus niger TaxID=5061 RepID=A0A9W6ACU7_ASPNG|nr:hypothetical protein CBS147353_11497 [Aspergillus niger]GLA56000.1 hypothetical protein AnigIFM63604_003489 [Aspergillus niger]